jgi:sulfur carrier protein
MTTGRSNIRVNGKLTALDIGTSIEEMLRSRNIDPETARSVAVAVNERVVRRGAWSETLLAPGDEVEIVTALQGG